MDGTEVFSVSRRPAPPLAGLVDGYHGYRMAGFAPGVHRGAPARHMTFIVAIGPEIDVVAQTNPADPPRRYRAVLSGLQASPALIAHDGYQEGVAIELRPLASRALFGLPARVLWDTSLELDEVVGAIGRELAERLDATDDWSARFDACDDVLLRLLTARVRAGAGVRAGGDGRARRGVAAEPDPALAAAWHALERTGGSVSIAAVADEVGWSRQHLRTRFVDELGLTPKVAGRVMRFERARRELLSGPTPLADVAALSGFYDQAHLTREFVELVGATPGQLRAEELPVFDGDGEGDTDREGEGDNLPSVQDEWLASGAQ
jgi:AraC-like DNA-binding protein